MHFHSGLGRQGGARLRCVTVADMTRANGRPLAQVQTRWGQNLIGFHHELLATDAALSAVEHHDGSDWFHAHGGCARHYYPALFELFIDRAVLFENFLLTEREMPFTTEIILPAFEAVCVRRNQRPLICRLDPLEQEGDPYWLQYPGELWPVVKSLADAQAGEGHLRLRRQFPG